MGIAIQSRSYRGHLRNPSPPAGIVDTCCDDWGSFFDEYDSDTQLQHTQQQLMPASKPLSSDSCPILIQFGEYCQENHTPATPTISVGEKYISVTVTVTV